MKSAKFSISFLVASILGVFLLPMQAKGGSEIYDPSVSNCTELNCSSIVFSGVIDRNNIGQSIPFVLPLYFQNGECTRIDITSQTGNLNLQAVLVSPTGRVWRNNGRPGNINLPLIQAYSDVQGWYTLQIYESSGVGPLGSNGFTLAYGRYNIGNSTNCPNQTPSF